MYIMINKEEFANALIHGVGAVFFTAAAPLLFFTLYLHNKLWLPWPIVVFVFCLLTTYVASSVYHAVTDSDYKRILRIMDHISIFLLIGGTFTPVVVYCMGDWNGWPFLACFWGVMFSGIIFKLYFTGKYKLVSTILYVAVAWLGAMFAGPLLHNIPGKVLFYIILGGIFYTSGTLFYMLKKLRFQHAVWHFFVLAGSMAHFYAILLLVGEVGAG